ncbi:MAG: hypothetical protein JXB13_18995 [Phycisphaerae bacterium]|nr:hypothetical protein [Phycisphaerae bacterium]
MNRETAVLAFAIAAACPLSAMAQGTGLPPGLTAHVRPVAGGFIDWAEGFILAEGKGIAESRDEQGQLMAQRAATVDASRNALAIALGVPLDGKALVGGAGDARVKIQGVIRGHQVKESEWFPNETPPRARVVLRVPFWGAKGVATVFYEKQRSAAARRANRLSLIAEEVDVSEAVLIIDARGLKTAPCLFPVVTDEQGRVVYDVSRIARDGRDRGPVVRYVESRLTLQELSALFEGPALQPRLASHQPVDPPAATTASRPTSAPATQPGTPDASTKRQRKRIVVKAADAGAASGTQIVLTTEDAEALRQTPEGASLLRSGRVVVVVDSAAAGIEGRGPTAEDETQIARAIP